MESEERYEITVILTRKVDVMRLVEHLHSKGDVNGDHTHSGRGHGNNSAEGEHKHLGQIKLATVLLVLSIVKKIQ